MGAHRCSRFQPIALLLLTVVATTLSLVSGQLTAPLNCSDPNRVCSAFLHYLLPPNQTIKDVETMFNVWSQDITMETNTTFTPTAPNQMMSLFIKVKCSCSSSSSTGQAPQYSYRVHSNGGQSYQGLSWNKGSSRGSVWLLCGCSSITYPFLLSYVVNKQDTLEVLSARFGSNGSDIIDLNDISNDQFLANDVLYYIPVNSAPGGSLASPSDLVPSQQGFIHPRKSGFPLGAIIGVVGGGAILLVIALGCILKRTPGENSKLSECFSCLDGEKQQHQLPHFAAARTPPTLSREMMTGVVDMEKPLTFSYQEVEAATENFKETNKLGQGAYGSVYFGILREQEVAVKRMKATKTKEFLAELKVLCKVHHSNLVELIGYASCEEELVLVYEYAENRSLSDRLHDPLSKGYTPLTWITRVQIALDAARGLEYIHDHTKAQYVHRDVKTSNILLDGNFRAKVADFGLAKLVEHGEGNEPITCIVGTFGYLAPEYLRDGHATAKSDVYAFGVVLFELISGREAISKSRVCVPSTPERRSLISIMFSALKDATPMNINRLRDVVDPMLENMYPSDCLHRVATLAKECVEEDPLMRPDMKKIVFTLSRVVFNSIEWEATLAGNSQIFSRIMQGR